MYHPFRAAFAELCKQAARWTWEPRRADVKAPESWIEMADGSGGLFYYCFVTKARPHANPHPHSHPHPHPNTNPNTYPNPNTNPNLNPNPNPNPNSTLTLNLTLTLTLNLTLTLTLTKAREFEMPSLSLQTTLGLPLGLTANAQAERMQHRFTKRMAKRLFSDSQLTAMKYNMELEQRSKARRAALALHEPLPVAQIAYVSQYLGVDSVVQPHLMWVASAALCDMLSPALPAGWEKVKPKADPYARSHKLPHYYHNMLLGAVQWEHPALTYWRSLLYDLLALEPAHVAGEVSPPKHNTWITAADDPAPGTYESIARLTGAAVGAGLPAPAAPAATAVAPTG